MMDPRYSPFEPKEGGPPVIDAELLRAAGLEVAGSVPPTRPQGKSRPRKSKGTAKGTVKGAGSVATTMSSPPEETLVAALDEAPAATERGEADSEDQAAAQLLGRVGGLSHRPAFVVPARPVLEIGTLQQRILWRDSATILSGVIIAMLLAEAVIPTNLGGEGGTPTPDPTTVTVMAPLPTFRLAGGGATPGEVVDPNLPLNRPTIIPVITLPPPTRKPSPSPSPTPRASVRPSASPTVRPSATPPPTAPPTAAPTPPPTPTPSPTKRTGPHKSPTP
ncbi:MAG: hypothetical protein ACAH65_12790 [Chloroflexota bacterium]